MPDDTTNLPIKQCRACDELLPATPEYFQSDSSEKDGLRYRCKNCERIGRSSKQKLFCPIAEIDGVRSKRCANCEKYYPATTDFFTADKSSKWGLSSWCKACRSDYQKAHTFPRTEEQRLRYNESARTYQRARHRSRGKEHREYQKLYRQKHPEYFREKWRRQALKNPEARKARGARRRSRQRGALTNFSYNDWKRCLEYFGGCCAVCGRPPGLWHFIAMDHWIPLNSPDCPGTIPTNIVPLCHSRRDGEGSCNTTKSALDGLDWLIGKLGERQGKKKFSEIQSYFKWIVDNPMGSTNGTTG